MSAFIEAPCRLVAQASGHTDLRCPLRHARLPVLEVTQLAAEHIALAHEVRTFIERRLRHRHAGDAHQHPAPGECRERDAKAVAGISQRFSRGTRALSSQTSAVS